MGGQNPERGRRHAVEATGLTHGTRLRRLELGAGFVGKAGDSIEIAAGQDQALVPPEGFDVRDLTLQIDVVFGIDLQMDRDRWVNGR